MKSTLLDSFFPNIEFAPSGLYGPLFAGLVQYYLDIPKGENIGPFGIPVSRKIFVYMVALQVGWLKWIKFRSKNNCEIKSPRKF